MSWRVFLGIFGPLLLLCVIPLQAMDVPDGSSVPSQIAYRPQKFSFTVVSDGNCAQNDRQNLHRCVFPVIDVAEVYPIFPALPFETSLKVEVSDACEIQGPVGYLKVLMKGRDQTPFLFLENLSIHQSHRIALQGLSSAPVASFQIYPKAESIFLNSVFKKNCTVMIHIELNQLAIHSVEELNAHHQALIKKSADLKKMHAVVEFLIRIKQNEEVLSGIGNTLQTLDVERKMVQEEWSELMDGVDIQSTSLLVFDSLFKRFLDSHRNGLKSASSSMKHVKSLDALSADLDLQALESSQRLLHETENEVKLAQFFLSQSPLCLKPKDRLLSVLESVLYEEVCAPQGIIDQITDSLSQIGRVEERDVNALL